MSLSDRVKALNDDLLKDLHKALDKFNCGDLHCNKCPLCGEDGVCIVVTVHQEFIRRES